jgi:hypothetical protein
MSGVDKTVLTMTDGRHSIHYGVDPVLGKYFQLFDKEFEEPSGQGLILDVDMHQGVKVNLTGYPAPDGDFTGGAIALTDYLFENEIDPEDPEATDKFIEWL